MNRVKDGNVRPSSAARAAEEEERREEELREKFGLPDDSYIPSATVNVWNIQLEGMILSIALGAFHYFYSFPIFCDKNRVCIYSSEI